MTEGVSASRRTAALFAFLRHYHPTIPRELLQLLPEAEQKDLVRAELRPDLLLPLAEILDGIHYSWVATVIRNDQARLLPLWCVALSGANQSGLTQLLGITDPLPSVAPPVKEFMMQALYRRLGLHEVLPVGMLPPSQLNSLVEVDKRVLVQVIDFLGLFDIAALLRRIVVPTLQQQVRDLLTESQRRQLDRALHSQDLLPPPQLDIAQWTQNKRQLNRLLQTLGLSRLGKALSGLEPSLTWHIVHRLDTGRGKLLLSYSQTKIQPTLEKRLIDQIDSLRQRLAPSSDEENK